MKLYELLDVAPNATQDEIKAAYRIQVHLHHPDRLQGANEKVRQYAEERLKKINAAYSVLSDPVKRRDYDERHRAQQMYGTPRARTIYDDDLDSEPEAGPTTRSRRGRRRTERDAARDWMRQQEEFRRAEEFMRRQREAAAQAERERREAEEHARRAARDRYPRAQRQVDRLSLLFKPGLWTTLVCIPAGEFLMGSDPLRDVLAQPSERPQHLVRLSEYFISQYPVTYEQYQIFLQATQAERLLEYPRERAMHPVVNVSWDEAVAFCNWLNSPGWKFRLPTEAEWEKAARGSDGRLYPWGDTWDISRANADDLADATTPVGLFSPAGDSPFGLADMSGNVWEWCADRYDPDEYAQRQVILNPTGPLLGDGVVIRGGAFDSTQKHARCAHRNWHYPFKRRNNIGFRVVAVPVDG